MDSITKRPIEATACPAVGAAQSRDELIAERERIDAELLATSPLHGIDTGARLGDLSHRVLGAAMLGRFDEDQQSTFRGLPADAFEPGLDRDAFEFLRGFEEPAGLGEALTARDHDLGDALGLLDELDREAPNVAGAGAVLAEFDLRCRQQRNRRILESASRDNDAGSLDAVPRVLAKLDAVGAKRRSSRRAPMLLGFDELLESSTGPPFVLRGLLGRTHVGLLYGAPGTFKSFLATDLGFSIANGDPLWAGRRIAEGGVIYCVGEGATGLKLRARGWLHGRNLEQAPPRRFVALDRAPQLLDPNDFADFVGLDLQAASERVGDLALIVIDTYSTATAGHDENGPAPAEFYGRAKEIAESFDCAVLIVHHTGKDGSRGPRGSSTFVGNFDVVFEVERPGESYSASVRSRKVKDGEPVVGMFELSRVPTGLTEVGDDGGQIELTTLRVSRANLVSGSTIQEPGENDLPRQIADTIATLGGATRRDLEAQLDVGERTLQRQLKSLLKDGYATRDKGYRYRLTEAGTEWLSA